MNHYAIDTGSEKKGSLGWVKANFDVGEFSITGGTTLKSAISSMILDLGLGPISIGFECPTYIELNPYDRTKSRLVDTIAWSS